MKVGKSSFLIDNVYLKNGAVVVGPKEYDGPLKEYFDFHFDDLRCGESSWEKAEMVMYKKAVDIVLKKSLLELKDIDLVVSGDLNNQIIIGNYCLRNTGVNYLGVFNACSSSVEGLIVASNLLEANNVKNAMVNISSHNATAERQFRYPTEYGGQKPQTLTSTVTVATSVILTKEKTNIQFKKATIGNIVDYKLTDTSDMGRAMAPAAWATLEKHLNDFQIDASYYDLIVTGDLSYYGKDLLCIIAKEKGINLYPNYNDCGVMIYDRDNQQVFSGGSGCGCLPGVSYSYILEQLKLGKLKKVLLIATGALHNPTIIFQKESIPVIAHAISMEVVN